MLYLPFDIFRPDRPRLGLLCQLCFFYCVSLTLRIPSCVVKQSCLQVYVTVKYSIYIAI